MAVKYFGTTFDIRDPWGSQEKDLINSIIQQINEKFVNQKNLLINLTWFGPQFNNGIYQQVHDVLQKDGSFDNLFWLSTVDPNALSSDLMADIESRAQVKNVYKIGGFDHSPHAFVFSVVPTADEFFAYERNSLLIKEVEHLYLCYNRKPHPHRIQLVEKLVQEDLLQDGIVTLGKNDMNYDVSGGLKTDLFLSVDETPDDYSCDKKYRVHTNFGGVPYDLLSLGRMDLWQNHFLNIVSETTFFPWDDLFITEKTWKPIIGLRPFLVNGQTTIYKFLRDNGFRTFTHLFKDIEFEDIAEYQVHDSIVAAIKRLKDMTKQQILDLYQSILPDLDHNRRRLFEFAQEQKRKMSDVFGQDQQI